MSRLTQEKQWRFTWLTEWSEIWDDTFLLEWRRLMSDGPNAHVFFEPQLVRWWLSEYLTKCKVQPCFCLAESVTGCRALYPLILVCGTWKDGWSRVIEPVGADGFDYLDPLFSHGVSQDILRAFWQEFSAEIIKTSGNTCEEVRVPRIRSPYTGGHRDLSESGRAPRILLENDQSLDDVLARVHKQLRQDVRRQSRRLAKLGPLCLRVFGPDEPDAAKAILPRFERWLQARWPGSIESDTCFSGLIDACLSEGYLHVSCLYCADRPVSWHIGFLHRQHFYYYKPAFDTELAQYSPGKVHIGKLMELLLPGAIRTFDFLRGCEPYKLLWTREAEELYSMVLTPPRLAAWLAPRTLGLMPKAINFCRQVRLRAHLRTR